MVNQIFRTRKWSKYVKKSASGINRRKQSVVATVSSTVRAGGHSTQRLSPETRKGERTGSSGVSVMASA